MIEMGIKERLAKANWELNVFFKTGRFPKIGYSLLPTTNSYRNPYPLQTAASIYNHHNIGTPQVSGGVSLQAAKARCSKCGSEVSTIAVYCHVCGFKVK